jgi:two-component system chemotaxis response regulator CheB
MKSDQFIVVIGTSAGGTTVLPELLKQLTDEMNISVFVVMHLSKMEVGDLLVKRLQKHSTFKCTIPSQGESIESRHIYFARPDHHMMVKKDKIIIGRGPMENRYRPSIDALFRSAAASHGPKAIGVILTGMLEDGAAGMMAIKKSGGKCIVQKPDEAEFPDMPKSVLNFLKPDYAIPVKEMGAAISALTSNGQIQQGMKIPDDILKEAEIAERVLIGMENVEGLGPRSAYSCPDCGGSLWEISNNGFTSYRCHVGHAYSENGLLSTMGASTESALWTALRIIEERKNLLRKIGNKEIQAGSKKVASNYFRRADELQAQIDHLKKVLFSTLSD